MKLKYMPKKFTSEKQKIGEIGENVASIFLLKQGYSIIDRNYTKKWGELDIVAEKDQIIHFLEVKSVARETLEGLESEINNYRPEDNMHPWKAKRLSRTIQTYLLDKDISEDKEWQVDLLVVYLDIKNKKARVKVEGNIIL
jgi:putative endonuclease